MWKATRPHHTRVNDSLTTVQSIVDVWLVFSNCIKFNGPEHTMSPMGKRSQELFENSVKNTPPHEEARPTPSRRLLPPPLPLPPNNACPDSDDYMGAESDDSEDGSQHRTSKFLPLPSNDNPNNPNPDELVIDVRLPTFSTGSNVPGFIFIHVLSGRLKAAFFVLLLLKFIGIIELWLCPAIIRS